MLELDTLNLPELVDEATQFESPPVTKVTRNLEVRRWLGRPVKRHLRKAPRTPQGVLGRPGIGKWVFALCSP